MPQLDKYIFFNQILGLITIFFFIYTYLRVRGIPIIGSLILYRKSRIALYKTVNKAMSFIALHRHKVWRARGNIFMPEFIKTFLEGLNTFEEKSNKKLTRLKNRFKKKIKKKFKNLKYSILKENLRVNELYN